MSPYSVQYPTASSLLLPVVSTSAPVSFESAIRICPRIRACTFCSARSQSGRACAASSCARKAACIGSMEISWKRMPRFRASAAASSREWSEL